PNQWETLGGPAATDTHAATHPATDSATFATGAATAADGSPAADPWYAVDQPAAPRPRRLRLHAGKLRWAPRSLTGRLVAGVVSLVVVLVLATGISTYMALRSFLTHRLDQQVQSVVPANNIDLRNLFAGDPSVNARVHQPQQIWAVAFTSSGLTVWSQS